MPNKITQGQRKYNPDDIKNEDKHNLCCVLLTKEKKKISFMVSVRPNPNSN